MRTGRRPGPTLSACALIMAMLVAALPACGGTRPAAVPDDNPTYERGTEVGRPSRSTAMQVPVRLRERVALLRSDPEGLPLSIVRALGSTHLYGANWTLAQALPHSPWPAWLVPGRGYVCLMQQESPRSGIGLACTSTEATLTSGVFITTISARATPGSARSRRSARPARRTVVGVVPDGAESVRVYTRGGQPRRARVADNVFSLRDSDLAPAESIALVR